MPAIRPHATVLRLLLVSPTRIFLCLMFDALCDKPYIVGANTEEQEGIEPRPQKRWVLHDATFFVFQNKILTFALVLVGPSEASTTSSSGVKTHQVQNPRGSLIPVSAYTLISLKEYGTHPKGWQIKDLLYNIKNKCMAWQILADH